MSIKQEFVFRCDICERQMKEDEYYYPWEHEEQEGVTYSLCKGCFFVTEKLASLGLLTGWKWTDKEMPVHGAIYFTRGFQESKWTSPR